MKHSEFTPAIRTNIKINFSIDVDNKFGELELNFVSSRAI